MANTNQTSLERSYEHCRRLTRERARNFYYGFRLLPKPRRDAFCAVYAFMRYADDVADIGDANDDKASLLQRWREALHRTLAGDCGESEIFPAFHDAVERYQIPPEYFEELITGTEMDLSIRSYRTFDELYQYCYRVASVVGLCSLHMFGFHDPRAKLLAEKCGIAFQLTNILRDIREDAASRRIYIPEEDLDHFRYSQQELKSGVRNQAFRQLIHFECARARAYYGDAAPLIGMVDVESRPALWTMISIYRGTLSVIERDVDRAGESSVADGSGSNDSTIVTKRASLSDSDKILIALRAAAMRLRLRAGGNPDWRVHA
jgi:phytoene synthase